VPARFLTSELFPSEPTPWSLKTHRLEPARLAVIFPAIVEAEGLFIDVPDLPLDVAFGVVNHLMAIPLLQPAIALQGVAVERRSRRDVLPYRIPATAAYAASLQPEPEPLRPHFLPGFAAIAPAALL